MYSFELRYLYESKTVKSKLTRYKIEELKDNQKDYIKNSNCF